MSIAISARSDLITYIVGMFDAAPGQSYLSTFVQQQAQGTSTSDLLNSLSNSTAFKNLYPESLSNSDFASQFIETLVGETVSAGGKSWASNWLLSKLEGGATRGDAMYTAISALMDIDLATPEWGNARIALENKATLAEYYSVIQGNSGSSLAELSAAINNPSVDLSTANKLVSQFTPGEPQPNSREGVGTHSDDIIQGTSSSEHLVGLDGNDQINGNGGDDFIEPGEGNDSITATAGSFSGLSYRMLDSGITVDMVAGTTTAVGKSDTFANIVYVDGTDFNDVIQGGNTNHDDWEGYRGGRGNDQMHGGSGYDELRYHQDYGSGITVNFATGTAIDPYGDTDTFSGMEAVRGTRLDDTFYGDANASFVSFRGLAGSDSLQGAEYNADTGTGWDRADYSRDAQEVDKEGNYGTAAVLVDLAANSATDGYGDTDTLINIDQVRGTSGNDQIFGNDGKNQLEGRSGDDTLKGRGGDDTLIGGSGADTFVFDTNWGNDTITDFEAGTDKLDFTETSLQFADLLITTSNGSTIIGDQSNNDITLTGIESISESDFIFS